MSKYQWFDNSESEKTAPKKHEQFDEHNNKKGQDLDKNENEIKGDRYIPLSFSAFLFSPQKKSNHLLDLGKKTRSLTHLVCILKNC